MATPTDNGAGSSQAQLPAPAKLVKIKSRLHKAEDLAFLRPGDRLAVADGAKGAIQIFSATGKPDIAFKAPRPTGVTANRSGLVMCVSHKSKKESEVHVINSHDGSIVSKWGGDMNWNPHGIVLSNKGQLVISNLHKFRHCVEVCTMDGRALVKFGNKGNGQKDFMNPYYVGVDIFDRILVSDHGNNCIKLYDDRSKFLACYGSVGTGPGQLRSPMGVCSDKAGNIHVCDTGNKRISVFSADGRFMQHLLTKTDALQWPHGIASSFDGQKLAISQHTSSQGGSFHKIRIYGLA